MAELNLMPLVVSVPPRAEPASNIMVFKVLVPAEVLTGVMSMPLTATVPEPAVLAKDKACPFPATAVV